MTTSRHLSCLMVVFSLLGISQVAEANPNDISLRGVGRPLTSSLDDPAVRRYRFLANELAIALAPRPLAPAETLGTNGFELSIATVHTPISASADYWQGQPGTPVLEGVTSGRKVPGSFWTPTAHIRKGLPMSMEVGITGSYLAFSEMFLMGAEFKIAWHESFFRYAPAVATRVAFGRLFGASDLDILTAEADVLASVPFGIGGMVQLTPYLGYGMLFAHVNSEVIDETPFLVTDLSEQRGDGGDRSGSLYNFPTIEWQNNRHHRLIGGLRLISAFIELTYEFDFIIVDGPNNMTSHSIKLGFDV